MFRHRHRFDPRGPDPSGAWRRACGKVSVSICCSIAIGVFVLLGWFIMRGAIEPNDIFLYEGEIVCPSKLIVNKISPNCVFIRRDY